MKAAFRLTALMLAVMLVCPLGAAMAATDGYYSSYTYNSRRNGCWSITF